jgi:hypothetical protein
MRKTLTSLVFLTSAFTVSAEETPSNLGGPFTAGERCVKQVMKDSAPGSIEAVQMSNHIMAQGHIDGRRIVASVFMQNGVVQDLDIHIQDPGDRNSQEIIGPQSAQATASYEQGGHVTTIGASERQKQASKILYDAHQKLRSCALIG